jgi:aldose 1-epimerase
LFLDRPAAPDRYRALRTHAPFPVFSTTIMLPAQSFGRLPDGREAHLFTLQNKSGARADITDFGGILVRLIVPDRSGKLDDVVLGFGSVEPYLDRSPFFGATIGRFGNRIAGARFTLDGVTYPLAANNTPGDQPCNLHGGPLGFDKVLWSATPFSEPGAAGLRLAHRSPDGDQGFPGNLSVAVEYRLTDANELRIDYSATTDKATPVNLTNHSYFNLRGEGHGDILGHQARFRASRYTPVSAGLIPTGQLAPVAGTPFDFTTAHTIGERIGARDTQLGFGNGYDHNYVVDPQPGAQLALAAEVYDPETGRVLEMLTAEPGFQFYSGNYIDAALTGNRGLPYGPRTGFCLESQHFPDSPNQPAFPSTILRPGQRYATTTVYRFTTR